MTKRLFSKATPWWLSLLIILIVLFILMVIGRFSHAGRRIESNASIVVWPLQMLVSKPVAAIRSFDNDLQNHHQLLMQNQQLRQQNFNLHVQLQKLTSLEQQNAQLKNLLSSSKSMAAKTKVANILAIHLNPMLQQIIIDQGANANLYNHQPVMDAFGVMGQVIDVAPLVSKILLITDKNSTIPVKDVRSGERAVAVGINRHQLSLMNVVDPSNFKPGDLLVTSGLGMQFPYGYPVGIVTQVKQLPTQTFASIAVKPAAHLNQSDQVLLVWPQKAALAKAVKAELQQPIQKAHRQ